MRCQMADQEKEIAVANARDPLRSIVAIAVRDPGIVKVSPNTYGLSGLSPNENGSQRKEEVRS